MNTTNMLRHCLKKAMVILPTSSFFKTVLHRGWFFYALIFVIPFFSSCKPERPHYTNLSDLEGGKTFAVPTGTVADQFVLDRFPDAKLLYYNTVPDCALAVKNGMADAAIYDLPVLKNIAAKNEGLVVLDDLLTPDNFGFAVQPDNMALKTVIDEVVLAAKADGTYREMFDRWFPDQGEPGPMPPIESTGEAGVLSFGTAAVTEPMAYHDKDRQITGFDIELALRVATKLNKRLDVIDLEFGALLPALISGRVEMVGAGMSITEERAKSVLFSESYYEGGIAALVRAPNGAGTATDAGKLMSVEDIANRKLGVLMGSIYDGYANRNYPEAEILTFNTVPDMFTALSSGKVDAVFADQPRLKDVFANYPGLGVLEEFLFFVDIGAGFRKSDGDLRLQFNEYLRQIRADGTYDDMSRRWLDEMSVVMPEIPSDGSSGVLKVGVVGDIGLPMTGRVQEGFVGFDVELATRFAAFLGKDVVLTDLPFASLLPALVSGRIDMIAASMMVTEERQQQIDFSDGYLNAGASVLVRAQDLIKDTGGLMHDMNDIADKQVGVYTGTVFDTFLATNHPAVRISRFDTTGDMILSLKTGKVDAVMLDLITANLVLRRNPELGLLSDDVFETPLGVGFNKNNPTLLTEFNDYLREIREDGTHARMVDRWFVNDPETAVMPEFDEPATGKKLVVGVSVEDLPYVAYMNGQFVGFDIEMVREFAKRRNYKLELVMIEFPALVAALASGKVDMITDGISISEERAQQINFSDGYAMFRTGVIALKKNLVKYQGERIEVVSAPFFEKVADSFYNNIIREKRYRLILNGLYITILITIFAALFGTVLGGIICFMRMSKSRLAYRSASLFIALIRGTPVLVLLMIIYYVIFASWNINPVLVAVIAFGINFAAYVSEMFRSSIVSIDNGQKEAGIASGFTKIQTFIHIIMPQALQRVLPVYKGEFISLLKMTSIVGYIAVQDLTKASDIIRSRTFDAFFPLIMAAVIYILLAWSLTIVLDRIEIGIDPKKRRVKKMKEVVQ